ncbi:MAG: DNA gyrase inhibitor YacG [Bradymonadaceae bacterium]
MNRSDCPICDDSVPPRDENDYYPFCSKRCKERDLARWLGENYSIPMTPDSTERRLQERPTDDENGD